MKRFKVLPGIHEPYDINKDNYEQYINQEIPYVVESGGHRRYYAVCPACDNPIQIIGMYQPLKDGRKNIGIHEKRTIHGVADYTEIQYRMCPYKANAGKSIAKELLKDMEPLNVEIYNTVRDYCDKVIYMVEQTLQMKISYAFAEKLLREYVVSRGFQYYWATLYNIPWMLLYMNTPFTMYKRILYAESPLVDFFSHEREVHIEELPDESGSEKCYQLIHDMPGFYDLDYWKHNRQVIDDEVLETVRVRIKKEKLKCQGSSYERTNEWETVFQFELQINEVRFLKLLKSEKAMEYRNQKLIDIAHRVMPEL